MSNEGFSGLKGKIAFASRDQLFVVNADGSDLKQLTHTRHYEGLPAWSPDGKQIAFTSNRDGDFEIYLMNADGSEQRRLTSHYSRTFGASWSPDGRYIVYNSQPFDDGQDQLFLMSVDARISIQLTSGPGFNREPNWSPDGKRIAFTSNRDRIQEIYVMTVNISSGTLDIAACTQTRLTYSRCANEFAKWSPNGRQIAFSNTGISVINVDGSNRQQLTDAQGLHNLPSWSPDGEHILFTSHGSFLATPRSLTSDIYIIDVDGSNQRHYDIFPQHSSAAVWWASA